MATQHQTPRPALDEEVELRRLTHAVLRLSRTAQACLKLRYLHRMSEEEIAEFLRISVPAVQGNLGRALRKLEENGGGGDGQRGREEEEE